MPQDTAFSNYRKLVRALCLAGAVAGGLLLWDKEQPNTAIFQCSQVQRQEYTQQLLDPKYVAQKEGFTYKECVPYHTVLHRLGILKKETCIEFYLQGGEQSLLVTEGNDLEREELVKLVDVDHDGVIDRGSFTCSTLVGLQVNFTNSDAGFTSTGCNGWLTATQARQQFREHQRWYKAFRDKHCLEVRIGEFRQSSF